METVTIFYDGDVTVILEQDGPIFRVTYGAEVHDGLDYVQAAHEFGECVLHSLACAGKIDNADGDDIADALDAQA